MALRITKTRARDSWRGIFYIGWVTRETEKYGFSVSFGKRTYLLCWR